MLTEEERVRGDRLHEARVTYDALQPSCPKCRTKQVQLCAWNAHKSRWMCRECRFKFRLAYEAGWEESAPLLSNTGPAPTASSRTPRASRRI